MQYIDGIPFKLKSAFDFGFLNEYGAVIDEITNVYTVGATAFAFFGGYNRTRDKWQLSDKLFEVAAKAVSDDRDGKQQSIRQLGEERETAICTEY